MNSQQQRNWSDIILLLLLPAPLTGLIVILGLVYVIASGTTISLGDDELAAESAEETVVPSTLAPNVAALATLSVAPNRVVPPPTPVDPLASGEGVEVAAALGYDEAMVNAGRNDFLAVCAACHGTDAHGIQGLGKTLVNSEFVRSKNDPDLLAFVTVGRQPWEPENTTGVQMPPRGGNPGLTDEDLMDIISYIRVLDGYIPDGTQVAVAPAETTSTEPTTVVEHTGPTPSEEFQPVDISAFLVSLGVTLPDPLPQPERTGKSLYAEFCGVRYGEDMVESAPDACDYLTETIAAGDASANDLFTTIALGNPLWDNTEPLNIQIPERGGYPPMTNDEIAQFLEYLYGQAGVEFDLDTEAIDIPDYEPLHTVPFNTSPSEGFQGADANTVVEATGVDVPESQEQTGRSGEAIYATFCTASADACEYLVSAIASGESDDAIFDLLANGAQLWNVENPPLGIPVRGGNPPMTDDEIRSFIEYLHTLAG